MRETSDEPDRLPNAPHPRETLALVGHGAQEQAFLDGAGARAGCTMPGCSAGRRASARRASPTASPASCWPRAIRSQRAAQAATLAMPEEDAATRRIMAQSHPDLHLLRRTLKPDGKSVHQQHPGRCRAPRARPLRIERGRGRLARRIVDSAEDMDRSAANALLKLLEEPPPRALFLIVAHAPGRAAADDPLALPAARPSRRWAQAEVAEAGRDRAGADGRSLRRFGAGARGRRSPTARCAAP